MNLQDKILSIKKQIPIDESFDILSREIKICDKNAFIVFVDGFAKDEILYYFLDYVQNSNKGFTDLDDFTKSQVAYIECEVVTDDGDYMEAATSVLSGMFLLVFEDYDGYVLLDTREYPSRAIEESSVEKVIRGAKDSFTETIIFNTALIRRRIRSSKLIFEIDKIGQYSKTDIAISYVDGLVNETVLNTVKEKIKNINTNEVILGAEYIEDFLFKKRWYNPLPLVKYTERPDVAAAYLSEGYVVIIIDTCPVAVVLPVSILHFTQHIGDYNVKFINGTFNIIFRIFSTLLSTFFAPIFVYLADHTSVLESISKKGDVPDEIYFSNFHQIIILEIMFLTLQMSSLHIPTQIATIIGILGGVVLSDIAIKLGIITPLSLLAMTVTVITTYSIPNVEFSNALRFFRFFMILSTGFFGLKGLIASMIILAIITVTTETIDGGKRYTYPLIPFNFKDLKSLLIRKNVKDAN